MAEGADAEPGSPARGVTPFFRLHRLSLHKRWSHFSELGQLYYPLKANDHPLLVEEIASIGGAFDVDEDDQVRWLMGLGVAPSRIQLGHPLRTWEQTVRARELGVRRFVVDTVEDFRRLLDLDPAQILLRLSPLDLVNATDPRHLKWGMRVGEALGLLEDKHSPSSIEYGLSFYLPPALYSMPNLAHALDAVVTNFRGMDISVLDVGGGLDESDKPDLLKLLNSTKTNLGVTQVIVEPGRNLLDPCIDLLTTVLDIRSRGPQRWAYLDVGIYRGLLDAVLIGKRFPVTLVNSDPIPDDWHRRIYTLVGPSADTLDYLGEYEFPRELVVGDLLQVHSCGAYAWSLRTMFGGMGPPGFEVEDD
jgi:ornithine decarboxylase